MPGQDTRALDLTLSVENNFGCGDCFGGMKHITDEIYMINSTCALILMLSSGFYFKNIVQSNCMKLYIAIARYEE